MLLKPERIGPLDYLGENWADYEPRYRPKTKAGDRAHRRLIDFAWLVHQSSDERFRNEIARHLDVDAFLRYLAATVLLSSMDSFMGLGHNYYLYLDPKKDRFFFVPWDLDHSFAGLLFLGSTASHSDLSIRQPQLGSNRLVQRILAEQKYFALYQALLRTMLKTAFTTQKVKNDLAAIKKVTSALEKRERQAAARRGEVTFSWGLGWLFTPTSDLAGFTQRRAASVESQLAGKTKGTVLSLPLIPLGEQPWIALSRPVLAATDRDRDGKLSRAEVEAGARALFRACDSGGKKSLDLRALAAGLRTLPLPATWGQSARSLSFTLARAVLARAGKEGKVSEESLVAAAVRLFDRADRDRSGALDERELVGALFELLPPPRVPFDPRPEPRPAAAKKEEKRK
jgi:hypothetical protein